MNRSLAAEADFNSELRFAGGAGSTIRGVAYSRLGRFGGSTRLLGVEPQRDRDVTIEAADPSAELAASPADQPVQSQRPPAAPRLCRRTLPMFLATDQHEFNETHPRATRRTDLMACAPFDDPRDPVRWRPHGVVDHAATTFVTNYSHIGEPP